MFVLFTTAKVSKIFKKLTAFGFPNVFQLREEEVYRDNSPLSDFCY